MLQTWLRLRPGAYACRCVSCISRNALTGSAATTGVSTKSGSRLTILFYSSIISTAATADVIVKRRRRDEWDRKINDLEAELQEHENPARRDTIGAADAAEGRTAAENAATASTKLPNFINPSSLASPMAQMDALKELVMEGGDLPGFYRLRGKLSGRSPWSMYATADQRSRRQDWTPKKRLNVEYAVAKLAARLMLAAPTQSAARIESLLATIADLDLKLERLKHRGPFEVGDLHGPSYPRYDADPDPSNHGARMLNRAILSLFQKCADGLITTSEMLLKLAYNLLISPHAPDTTTFTKLIGRLSRLGCSNEAASAIEAMDEAHLRYDEMAVDSILNHYIRCRDLAGFHKYVLKVQGYHQGLQLAHPETIISDETPARYRRWGNKVLESVDLDPRLYNTIVIGYRTFGYTKSKTEWDNAMALEHVPHNVANLLSPLSNCVRQRKWDQGLHIWTHIERLLSNPSTASSISRDHEANAYHFMLELCRSTGHYEHFKNFYSMSMLREFRIDEVFLGHDAIKRPAAVVDAWKSRRRRLAATQHQLDLLDESMREISVQLLASKIICSGLSVQQVKDLFVAENLERLYDAWVQERPWLRNGSPDPAQLPQEEAASGFTPSERMRVVRRNGKTKVVGRVRRVDAIDVGAKHVELPSAKQAGPSSPGATLGDTDEQINDLVRSTAAVSSQPHSTKLRNASTDTRWELLSNSKSHIAIMTA